jgi:site-specific DNA-methyltransferase (adenine-specific)
MPLHADIMVRGREIGFDNLTPIFWNKIANANYEVARGGGFLGKPFEPNAIIKNDVEYILFLRKPGAYRQPTEEQRRLSRLTKDEYNKWFRSFWTDVPGESTRSHPAPFPIELAYRLVRMFSFVGDTVLDPFSGTFTSTMAAMLCGRNSIGTELDEEYFASGVNRVQAESDNHLLFGSTPDVVIRQH